MLLKDLPQHHAVLIVNSNRTQLAEALFNELSLLSPAHRFFNQTVLDIETARKLISFAQAPYNSEKIALVSFHTIGHEAQNALLKILEEPRALVRFILVTSNKASLFDTVLSRLQLVSSQGDDTSLVSSDLFLKTKHTERMKLPFVVELLARVDEEERKDREGVRGFILSLSSSLLKNNAESKYILKTIEMAYHASMPSASGKALIEYLALLLPQPKV